MSTKGTPMSMMCFGELPLKMRSLTGDYFSNEFTYLQVSLAPCLSDVIGECATKDEVTAFYEANPTLQFMFLDHYYDFNDYEILFQSYVNTINYVSVD